MYVDEGRQMEGMFARIKEQGCVTSLDMAAVDPDSEAGKADWSSILKKVLPYVDFFVPSVEELCFMLDRERFTEWQKRAEGRDITEILNIEKDVRPLADICMQYGVKVLLIKCGVPGMYYRTAAADEIESIVKAVPNVEYEVFMRRNGCAFSDANCLGMHRKEMCSICSSIMHADKQMIMQKNDFHTQNAVELNDMIYTNSFHQFACGLCSIYRFVKLGITAGKIVGRCDEWRNICRDIEYMIKNIEIAKTCMSEEEYLEKMIFPEDRNIMCKLGLSCYYPEIRF
jgi:hypothetical protein